MNPIKRIGLVLLSGLCLQTATVAETIFVDGDVDGIPDERDDCLYSPPDRPVNPQGCPQELDADRDGLPDDLDACPYSALGSVVDAKGCALDQDKDGIPDGLDRCPDSLQETVDSCGCTVEQQLANPKLSGCGRPDFSGRDLPIASSPTPTLAPTLNKPILVTPTPKPPIKPPVKPPIKPPVLKPVQPSKPDELDETVKPLIIKPSKAPVRIVPLSDLSQAEAKPEGTATPAVRIPTSVAKPVVPVAPTLVVVQPPVVKPPVVKPLAVKPTLKPPAKPTKASGIPPRPWVVSSTLVNRQRLRFANPREELTFVDRAALERAVDKIAELAVGLQSKQVEIVVYISPKADVLTRYWARERAELVKAYLLAAGFSANDVALIESKQAQPKPTLDLELRRVLNESTSRPRN
jgi:hypothetical protein